MQLEAQQGTQQVPRQPQLCDDVLQQVAQLAESLCQANQPPHPLLPMQEQGESSAQPRHQASNAPGAGSAAEAATTAASTEGVAEALAEVLERRLATRLGQQVLQLSEVLRCVVQAQVGTQARFASLAATTACGSGSRPQAGMPHGGGEAEHQLDCNEQLAATRPTTGEELKRRHAIDDLYNELRRLEVTCPGSSTDEPKYTGSGAGGWDRCGEDHKSLTQQCAPVPPQSTWSRSARGLL